MTMLSYFSAVGIPPEERGLVSNERKRAEQIITKICNYYHISEYQVRAYNRKHNIAQARMWCMFFIRMETGLTLLETARLFSGRDHTTCIHAVQTVKNQIYAKHPNPMKADYEKLLELIL